MVSKFRAMRRAAIGARSISLADQAARIRMNWPMLRARVEGGALIVTGELQPTALSETYRIRLAYGNDEPPKAFVLSPAIRPRDDGTPIPHVYPGPRPCLYLPGSGEWTNRKFIATTIIPWLMLWLAYYELWHATGVWQGGGVEHPPRPTNERGESEAKDEPLPAALEHAAPESN